MGGITGKRVPLLYIKIKASAELQQQNQSFTINIFNMDYK